MKDPYLQMGGILEAFKKMGGCGQFLALRLTNSRGRGVGHERKYPVDME